MGVTSFGLLLGLLLLGTTGCNEAVAVDHNAADHHPEVKDTPSVDRPVLPQENRGTANQKNTSPKNNQKLVIDVAPVVRADLTTEIELVGTLIPIRKTTVVAEIDGSVAEIAPCDHTIQVDGAEVPLSIDIGSRVKQGDVLVRLKDRDQRLALAVAKANQARLESELRNLLSWRRDEEVAQLEATLEEMKARAICAKADLDRYSRLVEKKAISQADYDEAVAEKIRAEAEVKKAEASLQIAKSGPTTEEIDVAKAHLAVSQAEVAVREDTLEKTVIRAPYDGIVTKRYVEVGDRLIEMMDSDVLDLVDARTLFAEVAVPERYQMGVATGQAARIMVEGLGEPIVGRIDRIDGKIDPQTRTFLIRITIDNTQETLKPGGFARVYLPVASTKAALTVPFSSVSFDSGRPSVFVYQNGRVVKREVNLGVSSREKYEITAGVEEGELVATGQIAVLSNGLSVTVRK